MIGSVVNLALSLVVALAPSSGTPRELRLAVATADTIIRAKDVNPVAWQTAREVRRDGLEAWYGTLSGMRLEVYDELREAVRRSRCFDNPVTFFLVVERSQVEPNGDLTVVGTAAVRRGDSSNFYTRDEKRQLADLEVAMQTERKRHHLAMRKISDGTQVRREIVDRHLDALADIGDRARLLKERFEPQAYERLVEAETASVRVTIPKSLAAALPPDKLPRLRALELRMVVTDFHIHPPLTAYDQPAAVAVVVGTVEEVAGAAYRDAPKPVTSGGTSPD